MNILVINCFTKVFVGIADGIDQSANIYGSSAGSSFIFENFLKHRKLRKVFRHISPQIDESRFIHDTLSIISQNSIDFVFVTGDNYTNIVSRNKQIIEDNSKAIVFVDDYNRLISLTNKWEMFQLCKTYNFPTPATILFTDYSKIANLINDEGITFPIVIKPPIATGSAGYLEISNPVELKNSKNKIIELLNEHEALLVQEFVEGELHDVVFCANEGKLVSALTQKRLLSLYDFGGGGIINQTTDEPELISFAERFLSHVPYSGVANFDFIKRSNGEYVLLECNTRFWGTTQLTIAAGLKMPQ